MTDVYAAVEAISIDTGFPTQKICNILDVSRSTYYAWHTRDRWEREQSLKELTPKIVTAFWRHKRRYGACRIASDLADQGITCGVQRVAAVLKNQGLRAIQPRSFVPKTTESRHTLVYSPNLLLDMADPTQVDAIWVGGHHLLALAWGRF